ncbi:MAG: YkgJ family cysteine cluster protein [Myxococcota bacterium]
MQVSVLASPRHACSGCGACCQGAVIHLMDGEAERLREQAVALDVADPVDGDTIRMHKGACAFLAENKLCRIHAEFGEDQKPTICQQFPLVWVETEAGLRAGVDPASVAWNTSQSEAAPELKPPLVMRPRPCHLSPDQAKVEARLVHLCGEPDTTLCTVLAALCGAKPTDDLPAGFADRWLQVVREAPLALLLGHRSVGPDHRDTLLPVVTELPDTPPAWPVLSPELDREAVLLIRDALYLRVVTKIPLVQATALLIAAGAVLCAWHNPEPAAFRRSLSLWCRTLRAGPFWQAMVPDPARLQWLATGEAPSQ